MKQFYAGITVLVAMVLGISSAQATVVYSQTEFASDGYQLDQSLSLVGAGNYTFTLVDFAFPDPFESLGLSVFDNNENLLGKITDFGEFTVYLETDEIWMSLFAETSDLLGLYGLQVDFLGKSLPTTGGSPVPIPGAIWLLISGMLPLIHLGRAHKKRLNKLS